MKKFGIRGKLPPGDPMRAPHLLGEGWAWEKWYDSEEERDRAYETLVAGTPYYRQGDIPSLELEKVSREDTS